MHRTVFTELDLQEDHKEILNEMSIHMNPNPERTFALVSREYLVATYNFSVGSTQYQEFQPVPLLLAREGIRRIKQCYELMRWKSVRMRFIIRTLPQQYGWIMISRSPYTSFNSAPYLNGGTPSDAAQATAHPVILSLNDQEGFSYDLPWLSQYEWRSDNNTTQKAIIDKMWYIHIKSTLTKRVDTSVSNAFRLDCYASFVDPEFTGPVLLQIDEDKGKEREKAVGQSEVRDRPGIIIEDDPPPNLQVIPSQQVPMATLANTVAVAASVAAVGTAAAGPAIGSIFSMFGTAASAAKSFLTASEVVTKTRSQFAEQSGVTQSTHGNSAMCTNDGGGTILDIEPDTSFVHPYKYADPHFKHSIRALAQRPQLVRWTSLVANQTVTMFAVPGFSEFYSVPDLTMDYGWMCYLSQFFRRWRGSIKYLFMFTTSSFVSARIVISCRWDAQNHMGIGDCPTKILTVKGDAQETMLVPYTLTTPWASTTPSLYNINSGDGRKQYPPQIRIQCQSCIGSGDVTPEVGVMVWASAGDDFIFDSYQYAVGYPTEPGQPRPKAKGQSDITKIMLSSKFEPPVGFKTPKPIPSSLTVEDLLYRWSNRSTDLTPSLVRVIEPSDGIIDGDVQNWDYLCSLFLYNSGTVRRRYFMDPASSNAEIQLQAISNNEYFIDNYSPCNGLAGTLPGSWPVLDYSCPFISSVEVSSSPFANTRAVEEQYAYACVQAGGGTFDATKCWIKAGNNFQLFYPLPLPTTSYWPWYQTFTFLKECPKVEG